MTPQGAPSKVEISKVYEPKPVEEKWAAAWRERRMFHAEPKGARERRFVIVIPPPNVTGALHIGHALNNTLQDVLIRHHRLLGSPTCWVPGTDHGGIATQNVMEKQLKAEKKARADLGRDAFLERMQAWVRECKQTILGQLARLGCALDWDRESFTMDEARAKSVYAAFEHLWKKGLVYRGHRMVNWCVRCGTALSDIEVEHEDRKTKLWHIRYPAADGGEGVVVATTRPETMLGDTAVAVHPDDGRYAAIVGKRVKLPLTSFEIPVVADPMVDQTFGTGVVKTTPAHDVNDFEVWQRHPEIGSRQVIGFDGKMTPAAGPAYAGLSREAARDKVVADLGERVVKVEDHANAVGICYRCASVIEPMLAWQWFVKMEPIAGPALAAHQDGRFKLFPGSWSKPYAEWMKGIKDWCISRQIWWGHQIPVWYCLECNGDISNRAFQTIPDLKGTVSFAKPPVCAHCGSSRGSFVQDPDVLDTWFSSALWPFSVFGWPEKTQDLAFFYPTSVLVTGYEILYLWVARMQMMGLELMGLVPFHTGVIHGIVRDKSGKKMSKSLGNVIDPLVMMDKYGTDAFRFSLVAQAHPGKDIPFAEESIVGARNFANKLWNSSRFVQMNLPPEPPQGGYRLESLDRSKLELADRWILAEYERALADAKARYEAYELAGACNVLYVFLWDTFCKWYIELAKVRLTGPEGPQKELVRTILVGVLLGTLRALHPVMPFITEELYQALKAYGGETADTILDTQPASVGSWSDARAVAEMATVTDVVAGLWNLRSELKVPPELRIKTFMRGPEEAVQLLLAHKAYVTAMAKLDELAAGPKPAHSATALAGGLSLYVPLEGIIDFAKERARLEKEQREIAAQLDRCKNQLANQAFVSRAPKSEVDTIRQRQVDFEAKHHRIKEILENLS
ncbi:MAG: valine--tRNA ligase [Elusimicrobia bacterium]|nr:valine--tRNA ligase [Elusimicrobiota bacterium]